MSISNPQKLVFYGKYRGRAPYYSPLMGGMGRGMKTGPHQPQRIQNSTTHKTWGVEGVKVTYFTLGVQF